ARLLAGGPAGGSAPRLGRRPFRLRRRPRRGPGWQPLRDRRHLSLAGDRGRVCAARRAPGARTEAARGRGGARRGHPRPRRGARGRGAARRRARQRPARGALGQRHPHRLAGRVRAVELVTLATCDLGAIVRGRAVVAAELGHQLAAGVSWLPANQSLTPLGPLAEHSPFGSTGDLRLLPDTATHVKVEGEEGHSALELVLCDITETDGRPWAACPRRFLREALERLRGELGASVHASFEHEFQLLREEPSALPFSLDAQRQAEPLPGRLMAALAEAGLQPERFFAEYSSHQFEIPVAPAEGVAAADRAVVFREVVREVARRCGLRATFTPLLDPAQAGNGVHLPLAL